MGANEESGVGPADNEAQPAVEELLGPVSLLKGPPTVVETAAYANQGADCAAKRR